MCQGSRLNRILRSGCVLLLAVTLSACSTVRPWRNLPMPQDANRVSTAQSTQPGHDSAVLMFVSLSGGGARAAAFGYGVLDALRQTRLPWRGSEFSLLDELDVISGVSGGSIVAAYYAAFGRQAFPAFEQQFLRQNFQDNLISYMFKPGNLYDLSSPWFGRSNLLERRLDELYQGKTFGDLSARQGQPQLLVAATDLTLGSSFEFTKKQFALICSDLASVPLSFAVAASSAVPIALSPMVLKNYSGICSSPGSGIKGDGAGDYRVRLLQDSQRSYLDAGARPYIHLVDGGLADNLGLRSLLDRSRADGSLRASVRQVSSTKIQKLVIIAVNAERDPSERIDTSDTVAGTLQVIDSLLFGAGARATLETLGMLRDTAQAWRNELGRADAADGRHDPFAEDAQIHVINVNLRDAPDLMGRQFLLQIPTTFSLPPDDVDRLMEAGRNTLRASPEFKALLKSLGAQPVEP